MKYKLGILLIIFCACNGSKHEKEIAVLTALARTSDSLQQYQRSIDIYTDIIKLDPNNYMAFNNRGRAYVWQRSNKKGFADFNRAVKLHPNAETYFSRAAAYIRSDDYDKALPDLYRVIAAEPKFAAAYYWLSLVEVRQGKLDSAKYYCYRADETGYQKEFSFFGWYAIYVSKGDYEAAEAEMSKAITFFPNVHVWYNNRAFARNYLHDWTGAIADSDTCIRMDPTFDYAYNNKGLALLHLNQTDSAMALINYAIKLNPRNPYAYKNRSEVFLALHRTSDACKDLVKAVQLNKDVFFKQEIEDLQKKNCPK